MKPKRESPAASANAVEAQKQGIISNSSNTENPPKSNKNKGGKRSRDKGARVERAIVRALQDHGFGAERVPLSGAAGGSYLGDVTIPLLGIDCVIEVKARADGFRELYSWLAERDLLVLKADRRDPLVVLRLGLATRIAMAAEKAKGGADA